MESVTLVLPMPPSANRYWRRVMPKGHGRPMTILSEEAREYKAAVAREAARIGVRAVLTGRVGVAYTLIPKRPKDWQSRARKNPDGWQDSIRCIDLDNSIKVLMDALNGVVIDDDKWARKIIIERGEPEDVAKLVVTVFKINKQSLQQGFAL